MIPLHTGMNDDTYSTQHTHTQKTKQTYTTHNAFTKLCMQTRNTQTHTQKAHNAHKNRTRQEHIIQTNIY